MCFVCFRVFHMGTHGTDNPVVDRVLCPCVYPCVSGGPPYKGGTPNTWYTWHTRPRGSVTSEWSSLHQFRKAALVGFLS